MNCSLFTYKYNCKEYPHVSGTGDPATCHSWRGIDLRMSDNLKDKLRVAEDNVRAMDEILHITELRTGDVDSSTLQVRKLKL